MPILRLVRNTKVPVLCRPQTIGISVAMYDLVSSICDGESGGHKCPRRGGPPWRRNPRPRGWGSRAGSVDRARPPVPSTNIASGLYESTCSMNRLAICMGSGMRNSTAGIERASSPRRKRMTLWSAPWRAISTPMISGAVGSSTSGRATASSTRGPSMNCSWPVRGKTRTRTRMKSDSPP
jgi:hypothetical protein